MNPDLHYPLVSADNDRVLTALVGDCDECDVITGCTDILFQGYYWNTSALTIAAILNSHK